MSVTPPSPCSLPRWLKRNVPKGNANHFTSKLIGELGLHTVCDHAKCPNRMECYSQKTATFLILGDICTRACRFCSVPKGHPLPPDPDEPRRVAEAVARLGLEHAVITCVTRDDLPDGGAEHFVRTINEIRARSALRVACPKIEVLPSDFAGNAAAVDRLVDAAPDVYNHNTETVPRLFRRIKGSGVFIGDGPPGGHSAESCRHKRLPTPLFSWTLEMFRRIRRRNPAIGLKTGLMLGMGETTEELLDTLADLFEAGCRLLTLGQYLQPSPRQMPVVRYLPPEEFEQLGEFARRIGYERVAAGPFVRSSYHAREMMRDQG
jgi:lipoyl synthase